MNKGIILNVSVAITRALEKSNVKTYKEAIAYAVNGCIFYLLSAFKSIGVADPEKEIANLLRQAIEQLESKGGAE